MGRSLFNMSLSWRGRNVNGVQPKGSVLAYSANCAASWRSMRCSIERITSRSRGAMTLMSSISV